MSEDHNISPNVKLEWSPEAVTALISFWKEKECLYNPKSPMYHNKHARVDALESIAMKMCDKVPNITTIDIRTKLNYLRSQYGRELLRVSESKKSGLGTDDIYVPTAYWFELLHFLKDFVQVRKGKSTISYVLDDRSISENDESASSSKRILSDGCTLSTDNRNTNPAGQKKRKKTSDYDEVLQSASVFLKKLSEPEKTQDKLTEGLLNFLAPSLTEITAKNLRDEVSSKIMLLVFEYIKKQRELDTLP